MEHTKTVRHHLTGCNNKFNCCAVPTEDAYYENNPVEASVKHEIEIEENSTK